MATILDTTNTANFTEIDFDILSFITHNTALVSTMKIQDLSSTLFTSNATIIRFCKKLELSGFSELKYILKKEVYKNKQPNNTFRDGLENGLATYKDFLDTLPINDILQVVDLICNGYPLYIHGRSLSSIPAEYLYTVLSSIDRRCIFMEDLHLMKRISTTIDKDSTIIIVSANSEYPVFESIIANAKRNGANIVLLISNPTSKAQSLADITLLTKDDNATYYGTDVNTRIGIITIIQILIELSQQRLLMNK